MTFCRHATIGAEEVTPEREVLDSIGVDVATEDGDEDALVRMYMLYK